jgi:hypothetical protein
MIAGGGVLRKLQRAANECPFRVRIDKTHREHNGSAFKLIATEVRVAMLRLATAT